MIFRSPSVIRNMKHTRFSLTRTFGVTLWGVLVFFKWDKMEFLRSKDYNVKTWGIKAWSEKGAHKATLKFAFKDKKYVSWTPLVSACCCKALHIMCSCQSILKSFQAVRFLRIGAPEIMPGISHSKNRGS